jgi:hypothetical protein
MTRPDAATTMQSGECHQNYSVSRIGMRYVTTASPRPKIIRTLFIFSNLGEPEERQGSPAASVISPALYCVRCSRGPLSGKDEASETLQSHNTILIAYSTKLDDPVTVIAKDRSSVLQYQQHFAPSTRVHHCMPQDACMAARLPQAEGYLSYYTFIKALIEVP